MKYNFFVLFLLYCSELFSVVSDRARTTNEFLTSITVSAPDVTVNTSGGSGGGGGGSGGIVTVNNANVGPPDASTADVSLDDDDVDGTTRLTILIANKSHKLTKTVTYSGSSNPAITISADNTTLDFDGRTLEYNGAAASGIHGITISAGTKNVVIKNGTIKNFPGSGIYAVATAGNEIESITIKNMLIMGNQNGITCDYVNNGVIAHNKLHKNTVSAGSVHGIEVKNSNVMYINSCHSIHNTAINGSCYGFIFDTTQNVIATNCVADLNTGTTQVSGFHITNCSSYNKIEACKSTSNTSSTDEGHGILVNNSSQILIEKSDTIDNTSTDGAQKSYGIRLTSSSNCTITHNNADRNDYGFHDDETSGTFSNFFLSNTARYNLEQDYHRPNSSAMSFVTIDPEFLKEGFSVSPFENVSIRTN